MHVFSGPKCTWFIENGTLIVKVRYRDKIYTYFLQTPLQFVLRALERDTRAWFFSFKTWNLVKRNAKLIGKECPHV